MINLSLVCNINIDISLPSVIKLVWSYDNVKYLLRDREVIFLTDEQENLLMPMTFHKKG